MSDSTSDIINRIVKSSDEELVAFYSEVSCNEKAFIAFHYIRFFLAMKGHPGLCRNVVSRLAREACRDIIYGTALKEVLMFDYDSGTIQFLESVSDADKEAIMKLFPGGVVI